MWAFLKSVAVLSAVITEVGCIVCEHCTQVGVENCTGVSKYCPEEVTWCETGFVNSTMEIIGTVFKAFKGCLSHANKDWCNTTTILRNSKTFMQTYRECCDSDLCNANQIVVPPVSQTPNGIKCPECLTSEKAEYCTPTGNIPCFGDERSCVSFKGSMARPGAVPQVTLLVLVDPIFILLSAIWQREEQGRPKFITFGLRP